MNPETVNPEKIVQQQLDAYNARDLEAWLATYASDAKQFEFPNKLLATGHAEIRARITERFLEPNLHAKLIHRTVMGNVVIDQELITRTFTEGTGTLEFVAMYEVQNNKITNAVFIVGPKTLDTQT